MHSKPFQNLVHVILIFYQWYSKAFPYISLILRTHFFFPIKVFYLYKCTISVGPEKVLKVTVLMYFSRLFSQLGFSATQLRNFYPLGYFEPPNYMRKYTNYEFNFLFYFSTCLNQINKEVNWYCWLKLSRAIGSELQNF